ncbi:MAG: 16S rRNA (adenine(1518)-N(6)/adenine(1519)-N(6))-dimethyltransferase RsmA [Candidatus Bathyarchaeota archaeon]|nr:16S rRNA (adenine(1518)-N(6)/adenine(1519)-N(6))-dimethyltransferase RsmA [Candidatus Bathyarchaeota archaeon]MCX8176793.1 16S rRNA (adenine(1518)-N(6)/adenine(1519)-N(6))-dimethyltransferase RsmA [Candidatus Bathyarchaeota archaeon]MDW8193322.1 16S rRNA (adenine(1518)-N(6)/adenine(1519)-N(6))-dimethyltransferase RsmA [Nitrososphaerota archaeon]
MSLSEEAKLILRKYRIVPKKRFGQHLLIEPSIFHILAEYASLSRNDTVLDVGAGLGFLTSFLAEKCRKVLAVEIDSRFVRLLREKLKNLHNVEVFEGDILKVTLPPFNKVVSIPPYNISSPFIEWLLNKNFDCAVLILQKEFSKRLTATVGDKNYGWLTVLAYYHFEIDLLDHVPKQLFYPPPKVDSVIVRLRPRAFPSFTVKNYLVFSRLVRALFSQRNRKVRNAIKPFIKMYLTSKSRIINFAGPIPFSDRRVRELAPEDFGELANALLY